MHGLNPALLFSSTRIRSTFADGIGNVHVGTGTAFWVKGLTRLVLVTNRHNVDPTMTFPHEPDLRLTELEVELRRFTTPGVPTSQTQFFRVENTSNIRRHHNADCAVLAAPVLASWQTEYDASQVALPKADIVTAQEFDELLIQPLETAFFVGFPGSGGKPWWDEYWQLPIGRQCIIASFPPLHFKNSMVKTNDALLVSGMSFTGSSGSPVYVPPLGIAPGGDIVDSAYRPAKLIGIMSGHFWQPSDTPRMFDHTGLSYLTRSSAIVDLLQEEGEWERPGAGGG